MEFIELEELVDMETEKSAFPAIRGENGLLEGWEIKKLGEVCEIVTGKWDANHATTNGKFRFYTCAYDYAYCDTSRFSGECLILPGNGANVGEVFYYNGEFDAYQRTYVIQNIKVLPKFLFYHLSYFVICLLYPQTVTWLSLRRYLWLFDFLLLFYQQLF